MSDAAPKTIPEPCTHCGLPVPPPIHGDGPHFCCNGCAAAWRILHKVGLGEYYALREQVGDSGSGRRVDPATEGRYAHFDDPEFLQQFQNRDGGVELHVEGMHCAACVWVMEQLPQALDGVTGARVDFGRSRIHIDWDPEAARLSDVADFLHQLGYSTSPMGVAAESARRSAQRAEILRLGVMFAITGNIMLIAFALYAGAAGPWARFFEWISLLLAIPAVTYGAWPFYRAAIGGLRARIAHIDLPITLGILAGFGASTVATVLGIGEIYFDSVSALVFLLLVGRFVQGRGQRAAMSQAELLAALTPGTAWRWADAQWHAVPANTLQAGDRVRVRSGETMPIDGVVHAGQSHVDLSLLTGESAPVPVGTGAEVFAGTICVGDTLEIDARATGRDTRLGHLVQLIEQVDAERAPIMQLADRVAGRFVIGIIALSIVGGIAWWLHDPSRVFDVVVSLLVVTCPCALGLATPVALAIARGRAASVGVLVRSSAALESLAQVQQIWFDKTGTLTEGQMTVAEAWLDPEHHALKPAIAALERRSIHPIAQAIATWAGPGSAAISDAHETTGRGIQGTYNGQTLELGAPDPLGGAGRFTPQLETLLAQGHTPVLITLDGAPVGLLALGDQIRDDSLAAVRRLQALGIKVGLLSGDHPAVARAVGTQLGITEALGGHTPEQKAAVVNTPRTAMIGDGFNDAAALRAATVGIAVHGGAEVAMQVADLFLGRPGAMAVVDAVEGAQRTLRIIRRNLTFSLLYNLCFATLALMGLISPLAAAVLMPISSLTVIGASVISRSFYAR
jgi:Cu2+-exporting ATPase